MLLKGSRRPVGSGLVDRLAPDMINYEIIRARHQAAFQLRIKVTGLNLLITLLKIKL